MAHLFFKKPGNYTMNEIFLMNKPALEWIIERYCVKTDKDSGIVKELPELE